VLLPQTVDESRLLRAAGERGVGAEGLALHRFAADGTPGVLLGYGSMSEPAIEQGVRLLSEAYAQARGHPR
jgi:GntR family transcriptional regulator/MocR family aminotransferase